MKEDFVGLHRDLVAYMLVWARTCEKKQPPHDEVRSRIRSLLEAQQERVTRESMNAENYKQGRFAICAWIDEMIMNSGWEHRQDWQKDLLQTEYYRTTNAGEEFFERISHLQPEQKAVREVYHLCLGLGFKGRYCWDDDMPKLKEIMQQNYAMLPGPPVEVRDLGLERLTPEAYVEEASGTPAPKPKPALNRTKLLLYALIPPALFILLFIIYRFVLGGALNSLTA
ncbi:MAG: DotU family type IV/VI secretion system protein [Proteobacteria bacterium]|nr:DotU family type IV/VI secretion system protein [Pseudomonadota bacterium]